MGNKLRRKRNKRSGMTAQPVKERVVEDGYANAAAFLGEESELMRAGTFQRSNLTRDVELLTLPRRHMAPDGFRAAVAAITNL